MSTKKFTIIASVLFALSVVVTPAFAACDIQHLDECDNAGLLQLIAGLGGSTTPTTPTTTPTGTITGIPAGFQFTQTLKQGSTGTEVKYLQIFLNSDPATAVGNAGNETSYFGSMTKAAVNKFQTKYAADILTPLGLTAPTGNWASATRAKANAILAAGGTTPSTGLPAGCTSTSGFSPVTGEPCSSGSGVILPTGCTSTSGYSPITGQPCSGGTVITGGFSARLASDNPAATTFVQGQASAELARYTFSNSTSADVVVTGVELTRIGISADATLANVYLFDGTTRLTDAATVSGGKATFNATTGIFTVPANSSKTIIVKSDLAAASNGQTIGVSLSGVTSNGTLNATLPIAGNINNIAAANLATVNLGGVLPANTTTDPVAGVRVWEATFTVNNRDVQFTKLALKQINSIDRADLSNFKLLVDGVEVATVASLDANNYVTFVFDKKLTTGARNVKVLADVNGGSSRVIQMSLRNKADIDVKDTEYGVYVAVTPAALTAGTLTVNQGVFTITNNNSALPITIANSASNVLIGKWTFKATGEAVKVETLTTGFNYNDADNDNGGVGGVGGTATLRNGKLMINGSQAGSTATLAMAGTAYTINYTFQPGVETTVELYADIFDNDGGAVGIEANDTIQAKLVNVASNATKQVSLGTMDVPTVAQAGNSVLSLLTVATGTATINPTSTYTSPQNTVIPQPTAKKIGSWTVTAGTSEDINVNNLGFAIASVTDDSFEVGDMYDMYTVYKIGSADAVTTSVTPTPVTPANFPVSFTLGKTQTVTIDLYAKLSDNGLNAAAGAEAITAGDSVRATLTVTGTGSQSGVAANFAGTTVGQTIVYQPAALNITRDASTPVSTLVSANQSVKTASYKFEAQNDTYTLVRLQFDIGDVTNVTSVNLKQGSTILQTQPASANVIFTGFSPALTVEPGTPKVLDVELVLGSVGAGAGTSGANIAVDFAGAASLVRPSSTGQVGAPGDAAAGNAIYVQKSYPTITGIALDTNGEKLVAGDRTLLKFKVSSNGDAIAWNKLIIGVTKTAANTIADGARLIDSATQAVVATLAAGDSDCEGAAATCTMTVLLAGGAEEQISGEKTYELKGTVGGTLALNSYIAPQISNTAVAKATNTNAIITGVGTNSFVWSDMSAQAHDVATTADWTNEFLVKTFPVSQTLTVK
ncbi:MAG: peptidoglycan-binding domain-containing protein [Candidatus Paceibacterota bacterium]